MKTYYAIICPLCGFKTVGNWEEKQIEYYFEHCAETHVPPPIIKKEKR